MKVRNQILVAAHDYERLRALVDHHAEGRDAASAELLEGELDRATVVTRDQLPPDVVTMNAQVVFEDENNGTRRELMLVYPSQANLGAGRVSVLAPIGAALLGLSVGQYIDWPTPSGRAARLRIVSVVQQQEVATTSA